MEAFDAWVKDNITKDAQRHRLHITKESGFMVSVIDGQHSVHAGTIIKAVMPHVNTTGYAMLYSASEFPACFGFVFVAHEFNVQQR